MPTLNETLARAPELLPADIEWLHQLVGDWQLISDLSFADLVLWVQVRPEPADAEHSRGGGSRLRSEAVPSQQPAAAEPAPQTEERVWMVAGHIRPNTGPLVIFEDVVGTRATPSRRVLLDRCAASQEPVRDPSAEWRDDRPIREEAYPVVRKGRRIAVITRHSNLATMRTPSRLEITYRAIADVLVTMISAGRFPLTDIPTAHRRGAPRVGDGVIRLDADGIITYASPNATSAVHRIGHRDQIVGEPLSRIVTDVLQDHSIVDESLPLVVTGKAPWRSDIEARGVSLSLRTVPLWAHEERIGALVLLRDVTELRRREREILTKDATIREIHHRVKNNLQTVAALIRLQSRRVPDDQAKAALLEAERRVGTIALVHDTLSRTLDEAVEFDEIVTRGLTAVVEVAGNSGAVEWSIEGSFGKVAAEDANALAMIVTELVHNAVEHGLAPDGGRLMITAERESAGDDEELLTVAVEDDGVGLPADFRAGSAGLGTQIVAALVQDLRGSITWGPRQGGGTVARFIARLRHWESETR
ncbi:sensor histidine kinase [Gephyromycinifex aptenodytis]|uniref:sensor histidine kinase n=1 Tax=Gephyromycinifex aptenodytis TaxID=2716227 RepID=UPI0014484CA7|nr:PAS domain-containing sensor histidine kinase [Gephyromycinifex aptenodytis]